MLTTEDEGPPPAHVSFVRRWVRAHPLASAIAPILLVVVLGFLRMESIADKSSDAAAEAKATAKQLVADRTEARTKACESYNEQQLRARAGADAQNRFVVGSILGRRPLTDEELALLEDLYDGAAKVAEESFPLRDCTPEGIAAFYGEDPPE